jgi:nicotinate (nicotinamide) nucleotide adenylyltransferase
MRSASRIGILGGTFDPVHLGHIETARTACGALDLDEVLVLPSGTPPHRQTPAVSRYHRFAMTALAVTGVERLRISDLEIGEEAASYTFDTLARLRARGLSASQIFFITGADAFAEIATWSRYPEVLDMAHFVVVSRPGCRATELRQRRIGAAPTKRNRGFFWSMPKRPTCHRRTFAGGSRAANRSPASYRTPSLGISINMVSTRALN